MVIRILITVIGVAGVLSAKWASELRAARLRAFFGREMKRIALADRVALTLGGLVLIGFGLVWPPGW